MSSSTISSTSPCNPLRMQWWCIQHPESEHAASTAKPIKEDCQAFALVVTCGPLHQLNLQSSKTQNPTFCWLQLFQPLAGNSSSTWIWLMQHQWCLCKCVVLYASAWSYNVVVCMQSVWYFPCSLLQWLFSILLPLRQIQRLVHGVPCWRRAGSFQLPLLLALLCHSALLLLEATPSIGFFASAARS